MASDGMAVAASLWCTGARPPAVAAAVALTLALNASARLYGHRYAVSALDDAPALAVRVLVALLLVRLPQPVERPWTAADPTGYGHLLLQAALCVAACVALRAVYFMAVRRVRRRHGAADRVLIVGGGAPAERVLGTLRQHPEYGLVGHGIIDPSGRPAGWDLPNFAGSGDPGQVIDLHRIDTMIVVPAEGEDPQAGSAVRAGLVTGCRMLQVNGGAAAVPARRVEYLNGVPVVELLRLPLRRPSWRIKRLTDVVVSILALALLWPVLAVCALAVRLEGGPGVIFRQRRIGLHGRPFVLLKFRTLKPVDEEESNTKWSIESDTRVGPVGRFLRGTSLDELPQLWNVIRGEMSLVGPRPERPYFVHQFAREIPGYALRHRVPVGLTGWAQVHGLRGNTSVSERALLDNFYIENWSLWIDTRIILMTLRSLVPWRR